MYIEPKNSGCCHGKHNPFSNICDRCFSMWNRNSKPTSNCNSRNYQLVCSLNRGILFGNWNKLHNAKYSNNDDILCRSNQ